MAVEWKKVHVFISSTFKDMHAERDYLVKRVFPKLNEWCERRRLRLVDIDLRWGVTEQDAQNRNVIKVCLNGIDACRPFFLCFLGQRRGWVPSYDPNKSEEDNQIPLSTMREFPDLAKYAGSTSATELEIIHALVDPLHRGKQRDPEKPGEYYDPTKFAFFYLREDSYLKEIDQPQLRLIYTNENKDDDRELEKWRTEKIPATGRPKHSYSARWDPELTTPELGLAGRLTDFQCQASPLDDVILKDLQEAITTRYPDHVESDELTDLQKELDQQEQFLYASSEGFIARGDDFKGLDDYMQGSSNQLFVLTAPAGMGKSTLLANWIERYRSDPHVDHSRESIHFRFIGQSDRSNTIYSLLHLLLREMKEVAGKFTEDIPDDPQQLRQEFPKLLEAIGKKGKVVLVLDALNQLESGLADLAWLPYQLPKNVKLIVSFKRGEPAAEELIQHMQGQVLLTDVKPFVHLDDRGKLVKAYLSQYLKDLDENHLKTLIELPGAENPLFLKVVLSELRVFGAFANLGRKIRSDFGETPISAFKGLLERLENDPAYSPITPKQVVPLLFGLMAHARQGLSGEDLTELFLQVLRTETNEISRQAASDSVNLYLRQVRPFLAYRDGSFDFFYESFMLAARDRYVGEEYPRRPAKEWHNLLAEYFKAQPLKWEHNGKEFLNKRKLSEQPHQQTYGELWSELKNTLTDFDFMEAKCISFSVYDLEKDYSTGLNLWTGEQKDIDVLRSFKDRLGLESHAINKAPELLFPQLYNHLTWLDMPDGPLHALCEAARQSRHNWLRMTQDPRPAPLLDRLPALGHTSGVTVVAVTPDGKQIVSGSKDTTILVWDLETGRSLRSLGKEINTVDTVVITPDGAQVISGSTDSAFHLWDLQSGRLLRSLEGHKNTFGVKALAVAPNGKQVVSGSKDTTIKIWDLETGRLLHSLEEYTSGVNAVAITPDGTQIVSGSDDNTVKVWDMETGRLLNSLKGHTGVVYAVAVTPDGTQVVSASNDKTIKIWELQGGHLLRTLEGHTQLVEAIAVTPDGTKVVSGSWDNTLRVWDMGTGRLLRTLEGHTDWVEAVAVTPDGKQVISGSNDKTIKIWDLLSGCLLHSLETHKSSVGAAAGTQVVPGSWEKTIKIRDLQQNGHVLRSLEGHKSYVNSVAIIQDSAQVISGSSDKTIKVWDLQSGRMLSSLEGHEETVSAVAVTPDSTQVVSGAVDNTVKVWDLQNGRMLYSLEGHTESVHAVPIMMGYIGVYAMAITQDGAQIVIGSGNIIQVSDLYSSRLLRTLEGHTDSVSAVAVTPDSTQIVSGSLDKTIKIWDLQSGRLLRSMEGHTGGVNDVAVTPDGKQVISGSIDNTIKIWELETGRLLRSMKKNSADVFAMAITPDGAQIVSGGWDKTIRVWQPATGESLTLFQNNSPIYCLTTDGHWLVCGDADGRVWIFEWMK